MATSPPPEHVERSGGVFPSLTGRTSRSSTRTEHTLNRRVNASIASLQQVQHEDLILGRQGSTSSSQRYQPHRHQETTSHPNNPQRPPLNDHLDPGHSFHPRGPPAAFSSPPPTAPAPSPPHLIPDPIIMNKELYYSSHKFRGFLHSFSLYSESFFRQLYFNMHLRLPSHYFSRVAMIFENAVLTIDEVQEMIREARRGGTARGYRTSMGGYITADGRIRQPTAYEKIEKSWNTLIESLLREWETLNVVSVLLLSAISTILQIDGAASYAVTRYTAFASLVCALMSLLYGCLFIARFASMKNTTRSVRWASEWAEEATRYRLPILWNVWVMLALPSTFLCWAIACFVACIMSFMWHSALQVPDSSPSTPSASNSTSTVPSSSSNSNTISPRTGRICCTIITIVLFIGLLYLLLVIMTFKRWGKRVEIWNERYNQAMGLAFGENPFPLRDVDGNVAEARDSVGENGSQDDGEVGEEASVGTESGVRNTGDVGRTQSHDLANDVHDSLAGVPTHSTVDMGVQS